MSWNPPEGIDIEEVEAVAREMGYISDKSPDEYFRDLRESGVTVFGVPERVNRYFDPQAENWTEPMFPAMDMPGGPLRKPIDPGEPVHDTRPTAVPNGRVPYRIYQL